MLIGCVICKLNALITFWGSKMMNNLNHNFIQKTASFSSISPGFHTGLRKPKGGTVGTTAKWSGTPHGQGTHTWLYSCQACQVTNHLVFKLFLKMLARQGKRKLSSILSHLNSYAIFFIFFKGREILTMSLNFRFQSALLL